MNPVYIIAEAGVNHNGSLDAARKMVDAALSAGVNAVKFQTFKAEKLLTKDTPKAEYQKGQTSGSESQYEMIKKLELSEQDHRELVSYCAYRGIDFLSAPFDLDSVELLYGLGMKTWKIPSGEITNLPLLRSIAGKAEDIILSTGMCTMEDIEAALKLIEDNGFDKDRMIILHCNTEYPTPFQDVNLKAMLTIKNELGVRVGYSDHTSGIEVPLAAVALGAEVIEKHFTLDKSMPGPDHQASLDPDELTEMVRTIRNVEKSLGDGVKRPNDSEKKNMPIARKSIVAAGPIRKGETFSESNLDVKRPGTGISPMEWDAILGKQAVKDFEPDELITF